MIWLQTAVVGLELDAHFQLVKIAPGDEVGVNMCVQGGPVADGAVQGAYVDEVEGARVCPWKCYVVDFEFAVGWREGGLDGGEVYACDFSGGVL
jgi:hypothetical protein